MTILTAAVVLVGVLCLADLLMTFGVISRLREQSAMLNQSHGLDMPVMELSAGDIPGSFEAVTVDGEPLAGPAGIRLAAFFSSSCSICPERVPTFVDYVRANGVRREDTIAVILTMADEPVPYADRLAEVARMCVQQPDAELAKAFKVTGYPAFCVLDASGAVQATGYDPAKLPQLAVA
jgi:hypothetical protein